MSNCSLSCVQPALGPDGRVLVDEALLEQRAAFLRDDSLVLIVMLTDENDCSTVASNDTWVFFAIDYTPDVPHYLRVCR